MKIVESNNQNTVIARTVPIGAVFVHQGSFHMRIDGAYVKDARYFPAVELATGRYVLIANVNDVILRPDVHMVAGYPACEPACDADITVGSLPDPTDVINVNGVDYYRQE